MSRDCKFQLQGIWVNAAEKGHGGTARGGETPDIGEPVGIVANGGFYGAVGF
jgi:hypothetical protein